MTTKCSAKYEYSGSHSVYYVGDVIANRNKLNG